VLLIPVSPIVDTALVSPEGWAGSRGARAHVSARGFVKLAFVNRVGELAEAGNTTRTRDPLRPRDPALVDALPAGSPTATGTAEKTSGLALAGPASATARAREIQVTTSLGKLLAGASRSDCRSLIAVSVWLDGVLGRRLYRQLYRARTFLAT
jgi:hypothetical protein